VDWGGEVLGDGLKGTAKGVHDEVCGRLCLVKRCCCHDDVVVLMKVGQCFREDKGASGGKV
jgi:hypothetical protein